MGQRKFATKMDAVWLGLLLLFSLLGWWQIITLQKAQTEKVIAHVFFNRHEVLQIPLRADEEKEFVLEEVPEIRLRRFADGSVAIVASDCPDQICVQAGRLAYPGQAVACLPRRVFLRLELADDEAGQEGHDNVADVVVGGKNGQSK